MYIFAIKNFGDLPTSTKILFALMGLSSADGKFDIKKSKLAEYVNVSKQTVGEHLNTFVKCNLLKRKYGGKGIFNPDIYYMGAPELKAKALADYKEFKSDVLTPEE